MKIEREICLNDKIENIEMQLKRVKKFVRSTKIQSLVERIGMKGQDSIQ